MNKIVFLMAVMASMSVAVDLKPVYTDKEIRVMAFSYKTMVNRPDDFKIADHIGVIFQSSEFFGYVAGAMDTHEMFKECAKTHAPRDIAHKAALVVDSLDENESAPSTITMLVAISSACDDSYWKK